MTRAPSRHRRLSAHVLAVTLLAAPGPLACRSGASARDVSIAVAPAAITVGPGSGAAVEATVLGAADPGVTWSVDEGASGGSVTADGIYGSYVAPDRLGTYHLRATSVADATRSAAATVTVTADGPTTPTLIPAARQTLWDPGLNAVGGIPGRTKVFTTLSPSGGDDTAAIQAALDGCPAEEVVQLAAGTFHLSGDGLLIRNSNITLRGAGPASTRLVKATGTGYPVIAMGTRWYKWTQQTAFAADALKGTRTATLVADPGLKVGELVHVSETYDPALTFYNPATQDGDYQGWGEGRQGPRAASRPIGQAMEVAAVDGTTVTFTTPFHIGFRASHAAHLARISDGAHVVQPVRYSGIEDLYVSNGEGGDGGGNIRVFATAYCWARNVESDASIGASFAFDGAFRCVLRDSYLHGTRDPNPGGGGYGVVVDSYAADNLIENDIAWSFNKVIAMRSSGGGNVVGYSYLEDGYGSGYPTIVEVGLNASHMTTPHHELFEGNQAFNFDSDTYWGNSIFVTVFRNHFTARRRALGPLATYVYVDPSGDRLHYEDAQNRRAVGLTNDIWWFSFVANVLGSADQTLLTPVSTWADGSALPAQTAWSYEALSPPSDATVPMWKLGYDGQDPGAPYDAGTQRTTQRDGNFDYVTTSVRWHGVGGAGAGTTPEPLPTIPDSLYLRAKPAFFGASAWPWVTPERAPDVLGTLPARARFDAADAAR